MSLLDFFKPIQSQAKGYDAPTDTATWTDMTGGTKYTPLTQNKSDKSLMANNKNWVYVAIHAITNAISEIDINLYKVDSKGDYIDESNIAYQLLKRPNNQMTGRTLIQSLFACLELTGKAYIAFRVEGSKKSIYPVSSDRVTPKYNKSTGELLGYDVMMPNATQGKFHTPNELICIYYSNPSNPAQGLSPLASIAEWVDTDNAITEFNRKFFENGAKLGGVIETDATSNGALALSKLSFEQQHQGASNAHKYAFLPKGQKLNTAGITQKDMEFSELDNRIRDKILAGLGVPKSVVGITESGSSRADADAKNYIFYQNTILPKMQVFVEFLNYFYLPALGINNQQYYFDFEDPIDDDKGLTAVRRQAELGGIPWKTINEVRAEDGLNPVESGDFILSPNSFLTPIGKPIEQQKIVTKSLNTLEEKIKNVIETVQTPLSQRPEFADMPRKDQEEILHKEFIERTGKYESRYKTEVLKFSNKLQTEIKNNLESVVKNFTLGEVKDVSGHVYKAFDDFISIEEKTDDFVAFSTPITNELLGKEGQAQMALLPVAERFNPLSKTVQDNLKTFLTLTGESFTTTQLKNASAQISAGISAGESIAQLTTRLEDVFKFANTAQAEMVTKDVVFGTANQASYEAYKQSGVVKTIKWHTSEAQNVCEWCSTLNGKIVDIDQEFVEDNVIRLENGRTLDTSFTGSMYPPIHSRCNCFTLAETIDTKAIGETDKIEAMIIELEKEIALSYE